MPDQQKHLAQARRNEDLYNHLAQVAPQFVDWQITALFYAALHYIDAYLAIKSVHPNNHEERNQYMGMVSHLKPIYVQYQDLQNRSRDARYELSAIRAGYQQDLYNQQFTKIRNHITQLISPPSSTARTPQTGP